MDPITREIRRRRRSTTFNGSVRLKRKLVRRMRGCIADGEYDFPIRQMVKHGQIADTPHFAELASLAITFSQPFEDNSMAFIVDFFESIPVGCFSEQIEEVFTFITEECRRLMQARVFQWETTQEDFHRLEAASRISGSDLLWDCFVPDELETTPPLSLREFWASHEDRPSQSSVKRALKYWNGFHEKTECDSIYSKIMAAVAFLDLDACYRGVWPREGYDEITMRLGNIALLAFRHTIPGVGLTGDFFDLYRRLYLSRDPA